jgi:predicted nucleic acid-binding protein
MICVDTTFLVDLWRNKDDQNHSTLKILNTYADERFFVPVHAAGEFLEGGANISQDRFNDSLRFLKLFEVGEASLDTAKNYARIVSDLRARKSLAGASKADMWIAAWAVEHNAALISRNTKHFGGIPRLLLVSY